MRETSYGGGSDGEGGRGVGGDVGAGGDCGGGSVERTAQP